MSTTCALVALGLVVEVAMIAMGFAVTMWAWRRNTRRDDTNTKSW